MDVDNSSSTENSLEGAVGGQTESTQVTNWAGALGNNKLDHDYVITVYFRKNNRVSSVSNTTLSVAQKGKLAFKRLLIPQGKLIFIDDSRRECIKFKISGSVPSHSLNLTTSFEAKPNLWTKPVAPVVKEKLVSIYWTSSSTEYADIERALSLFGILTGNIEYQVYRARENCEEEERMMDGVMSMDRQVMMKVRKNIPSIILIGGKKANIRYDGQARTCSRCLMKLHVCPAKGDPKLCQEVWEHKDDENLPEEMQRMADRAKPRGDLEEMMRYFEMNPAENYGDNTADSSSGIYADWVELHNIPEEVTKQQLFEYIRKKDININIGQLMRDDVTKTKWRLTEMLPQEVECVMMLIHGNKIGKDGRRIQCIPAMTSTPPANRTNHWFNPSAEPTPTSSEESGVQTDTSGSSGATADGSVTARKNLADDMKKLDEVEVSHQTANANPDANGHKSTDLVNQTNLNENLQEVSDPEVKEVDSDGNTLPRPSTKITLKKREEGYEVKDDADVLMTVFKECVPKPATQRRRTNSVPPKPQKADVTLGLKETKAKEKEFERLKKEAVKLAEKEKKEQEKKEKARKKLEDMVAAAQVEDEQAQKEAKEKADKANTSKDEADMKAAEKAEKMAANARKKKMNLEEKLKELIKKAEDLKNLTKDGGQKRENSVSPGKSEEEGSGEKPKKGKASKKKKSKEEEDLEKSLFN